MRHSGSVKIGVLSVLAAAFFSLFLSDWVYQAFLEIRVPLIQEPAQNAENSVTVRFGRPRVNKRVRIVILKLVNEADRTTRVELYVNSIKSGVFLLPPKQTKRTFLLLQKDLPFGKTNVMELKGDGQDWRLDRIELRNFYRSSTGFFAYLIVDKGFPFYGAPLLSFVAVFFVILFALGLFLPTSFSAPYKKKISLLFLSAVLFLLIAIVSVNIFSQYQVLLHLRTFLVLTFLFYSQALWNIYRKAHEKAKAASSQAGFIVDSSIVILLVFLFFLGSMSYLFNQYEGNFSGFLQLSKRRVESAPFVTDQLLQDLILIKRGGYDGQWFYLMTFDPLISQFHPSQYKEFIDAPPFRYRRIGLSLLTKLFSFDRPELYPEAQNLIVLFSFAAMAFFLIKIALHYQCSPFWALLLILVPGFSQSIRYSLPEPLAATFLLAGIYFYLKEKPVFSAIAFALCLLIRETGILVLLVIAGWEFLKKDKRTSVILALSVVPYAAWRCFVTWRLFGYYGWSGFYYEPANLDIPYRGIMELFGVIAAGNYRVPAAGVLFPIALTLLLAIFTFAFLKNKYFIALAGIIYSVLAVSLSFSKVWVAVGNAERQTFECFLLLIVLFFSLRQKKSLLQYACLLFFALLFYYDIYYLTVVDSFRAGFTWFLL